MGKNWSSLCGVFYQSDRCGHRDQGKATGLNARQEQARQAIEACHCQLLFLPPYSPDFTPIEQAFSKIKAILRGLGARTKEALQEAVRLAIEAITRHDAAAWF